MTEIGTVPDLVPPSVRLPPTSLATCRRAARWALARLPDRGWMLAWLALLPMAITRAGTLAESDTFWQIRAGEAMLDTGRIPTTDPFSWSMPGRSWHPNSWGFDVAVAVAYRLGGLPLVALLGAALLLAIYAAMLYYARRTGVSVRAAVGAAAVFYPLLITWWSVRPHMIDYLVLLPLVLLSKAAMDGENSRQRYRAVAGILVLHVVWVNLHAAALLGIGVVGVFACTRLVADRSLTTLSRVTLPVLAAAVGSLANPLGTGLVAQTLDVRQASTGIITEWSRIDGRQPELVIVVALGVIVAVALARRREYDLALLCGGLAVAGATAIRFVPLLAVMAAPHLATLRWHPRPGSWLDTRSRMLRFGAALAVSLLIAASILGAVRAVTHLGEPIYDTGKLRALPSGCKVYNSDTIGGLIILYRPDVPVAIDGRNDMYGRKYITHVWDVISSTSGGVAELDSLGITCVAIEPHMRLAKQLRASDRWQRVASGQRVEIFTPR